MTNLGRKLDRIRRAERKLARLTSRGARRRTLQRQSSRIDGLKDRLELSKAKADAAKALQTANT